MTHYCKCKKPEPKRISGGSWECEACGDVIYFTRCEELGLS